jgi:hypothetical protein
MRSFCLFLFLGLMLALDCPAVLAEAADVGKKPSSNQWVSHQMNQPPPPSGSRNQLSDDVVEDVRQLYLQAMKEQDAKGAKQDSGQ